MNKPDSKLYTKQRFLVILLTQRSAGKLCLQGHSPEEKQHLQDIFFLGIYSLHLARLVTVPPRQDS